MFLPVRHSSKFDPQSLFRQATFFSHIKKFFVEDKEYNIFFKPYCAGRIGVHIIVSDLPTHLSGRKSSRKLKRTCLDKLENEHNNSSIRQS